ncbi:cysteine-rich receptor-like protein kinase 10 isoform X1 [Panicum miliaceum]|uniref:Cysteine-rich receptor-like protein kinase 10 isoform X1 n=1 Tax=Panicum miliaceum TaxID=4540 RepID=A0A3L6PCV5_PANMI|nr:cysteine-rich receptor-like protein kinase 10 isoform X1 [Panicum miliaceum]
MNSRFPRIASDSTEIHIQGGNQVCDVAKQAAGAVALQEQKILDTEDLLELCIRTEEYCSAFKKFEFFQIVDATDNFSENRNVGCGGFATIYKEPLQGQLPNGLMVAIKRMDVYATVFDFSSEFLLARLQHTNLIRLLGWCIHEKERILVYDFMHKGNLHWHIWETLVHLILDKRNGSLLDWSKRLNIIKGLADGLVYLHKQSMLWIVHRDLKPQNILLDHDMNPKITDFGSARTLSSDVAEERTSSVVGTSGYKAPEYTSRGIYSLKTDVFSFGVMALMIISGRKNTIMEQQGDSVGTLVRDAWQLWNDGRLHELVDPILGGDGFEPAEVMRYAQVALLCAQEDPTDRPTMSDVVALLNFESISLLPDPKQPSDLIKGGAASDKLCTYVSQSSRTIDITITSSAPMSTRVHIIVEPET